MKEAVDMMALGLAHDLSNIISIISGSILEIERQPDLHSVTSHMPYAKEGIKQARKLIDNILINSKHSMPEGGVVTISVTKVELTKEDPLSHGMGKYILIQFEDEGGGIPDEILNKIFLPYFSSKLTGKGLGLSICDSIAKSHGGYIQVKSDLGKGTIFETYLPLSE